MIQVVNYPETGRYLLDGNNTNIEIKSTNGAGYYFRATIYINDEVFDVQSWSRRDNYTAVKDLLYLYYAYFAPVFNSEFSSGLVEQTHLIKKINIDVTEYDLETDTATETIALPEFYIMYSHNSAVFSDTDPVSVLGLDAQSMRVPSNGKIVIPFFINAAAEDLTVTATLDNDTELNSQTAAAQTGKKVFLYTLNLADVTINYADLFITVTIQLGANDPVTVNYTIIRNPDYSIKELVFLNNFGFYIPAFFSGELSATSGYKPLIYEDYNGAEIVYNVDEKIKYSINTSYLFTTENPIVNQIATAIKTRFFYDNQYLEVVADTKRSEDKTDKEHLYNTKLEFEFKRAINKTNGGFLTAPTCQDIEVTGDESATTTIAKTLFNTAFSPNTVNFIVFNQLPADGTLYRVVSGVPISIQLNTAYDFSLISEFRYIPPVGEFGDDYANFVFQVKDGLLYSNEATAVINITEVPPGPQPPVIDTDPTVLLRLVAGDGAVTINSTITDENGDLDTILWEFEGTPHPDTVITDETTENPTVTITTGSPGTFQIKCTATDLAANQTVSIVTILATSHIVEIESDLQPESTGSTASDTDRVYQINISNGIENETIDLIFDYDVYSAASYVLINYGDVNEALISLMARRQVFQYTFNASGEISFFVYMEDAAADNHETMTIQVVKPTGAVQVDTNNDTIEI